MAKGSGTSGRATPTAGKAYLTREQAMAQLSAAADYLPDMAAGFAIGNDFDEGDARASRSIAVDGGRHVPMVNFSIRNMNGRWVLEDRVELGEAVKLIRDGARRKALRGAIAKATR